MEIDGIDFSSIQLDPLFDPIKKLLEFFVLSIAFLSQKDFQKTMLQTHPSLKPLLDDFNNEVNLRQEGNVMKFDAKLYWTSIGKVMIIALFDVLQFSPKHHNLLKNKDIFRFAKYVRNGAAHDNKFIHLPEEPITWRHLTLERSLNGSFVLPDFITPAHLVTLMMDISEIIRKKDI